MFSKNVWLYVSCAIWFPLGAQDSLLKHKIIINASVGGGAIGSMVSLNQIWYKPYQNQDFHFFNDSKNWMQMDKCGHAFTGYLLTKELGSIYSLAYAKKGPYYAAGISMAYLTTLEVLDGYSSAWGFSGYDVLANSFGVGLALVQNRLEQKDLFYPKFSFFPSPYASLRPDVLGSNFGEQVLKDYNGQTYWISVPLKCFYPLPKKLEFICLSLGYSVDQKLVGDEDTYLNYTAKRELLISLDIDLSKIARNKPKLNRILSHLNYIKIPFSTIGFVKNKFSFYPIYY